MTDADKIQPCSFTASCCLSHKQVILLHQTVFTASWALASVCQRRWRGPGLNWQVELQLHQPSLRLPRMCRAVMAMCRAEWLPQSTLGTLGTTAASPEASPAFTEAAVHAQGSHGHVQNGVAAAECHMVLTATLAPASTRQRICYGSGPYWQLMLHLYLPSLVQLRMCRAVMAMCRAEWLLQSMLGLLGTTAA